MIRAAALALVALAATLAGAAPASAAGECKGLKICIPVAGPWVVIPAPAHGSSSAFWKLACPQGVVAGVAGGVVLGANGSAVGVSSEVNHESGVGGVSAGGSSCPEAKTVSML